MINYEYDFITYIYSYINDNQREIAKLIDYDFYSKDYHNQNFIKYFNGANNLLMNLYNKKNNNSEKKLIKENI